MNASRPYETGFRLKRVETAAGWHLGNDRWREPSERTAPREPLIQSNEPHPNTADFREAFREASFRRDLVLAQGSPRRVLQRALVELPSFFDSQFLCFRRVAEHSDFSYGSEGRRSDSTTNPS